MTLRTIRSDSMEMSGWTDALAQVLQPHTDESRMDVQDLGKNPRLTRHPAGQFWRSTLSQAIHSDLSLGICGVRRFVGLEFPGLGGIISYNLPSGGEQERLSVESVYGNEERGTEGMNVDDLIDAIQGRLVYFPAYACTSFAIGQAMNAFVHSPKFTPKTLRHGFMVDAAPFNSFNRIDYSVHPASYPIVPAVNMSPYLKSTKHLMKIRQFSHKQPSAFEARPYAWREFLARKIAEKRQAEAEAEAAAAAAQELEADEDTDVDETLDDSMSTADTLAPETPLNSLKSNITHTSPCALMDSDIDVAPLMLECPASKLQDGPMTRSRSIFDISPITFDSADAQVTLSALTCGGSIEASLEKKMVKTTD